MTARDGVCDGVAQLLDLIEGKWTTQAIGVAAELAIADHVTGGSTTVEELATATGAHAPSLARLMRALATLGLCTQDPAGRYALTPLGLLLRADGEPSLRAWARWGASHQWQPWGRLLESVRSGQSARVLAGEARGYSHLEADAAKAATFNRAMTEITRLVAAAVSGAWDFAAVGRIADIGGGYGEMLCKVLAEHAHLQGVLFDLPHAIEGAREHVARAGFAERVVHVSGDFFKEMPGGCDAYLLKSIVHNWDDASAERILHSCREAMEPAARLLLVERVMPERPTGEDDDPRIVRADLNMLVTHGGRERTRAEFNQLLGRCGFTPLRFAPLVVGFSLIEARPA